jgi:AraC-like DNA-binding protein
VFALSIAMGALRPLAAQLVRDRVDAGAFFRGRGLDPALLANPEARAPVTRLIGIWEAAAEAAQNPCFGLSAAEHLDRDLGLVSDLCSVSSTLGEALANLSRYLRIITETVVVKTEVEGPTARLSAVFRMPPFAQGRHVTEFTIGALFRLMNQLAKVPVVPREVSFRHAVPDDVAARHRQVFGAPVRFRGELDGLELEAAALGRAVVGADPARARSLEALASRVLTESRRAGPLSDQVARAQMGRLRAGHEPQLEAVADELATTPRTLQRTLREEGTSFAAVLETLRRGLALFYLAEPQMPVAQVALLLGFSEPAPFHRAFKRWTGTTPAKWRASRASE